jgi:hypothetical protein
MTLSIKSKRLSVAEQPSCHPELVLDYRRSAGVTSGLTWGFQPRRNPLFQDLALGKSHYLLNLISASICTGKKTLQKSYIFIGGQILKHQRSIWSFRMT